MDSSRRSFIISSLKAMALGVLSPNLAPVDLDSEKFHREIDCLERALSQFMEITYYTTANINAALGEVSRAGFVEYVDSVKMHFKTFENRRDIFVEGKDALLNYLAQPFAKLVYDETKNHYVNNAGSKPEELPSFDEMAGKIIAESQKPSEHYQNKRDEVLAEIFQQRLSFPELCQPNFADMAAARKALQYPVSVPQILRDDNDFTLSAIKKSYAQNSYIEIVQNKSSSCEAKAR